MLSRNLRREFSRRTFTVFGASSPAVVVAFLTTSTTAGSNATTTTSHRPLLQEQRRGYSSGGDNYGPSSQQPQSLRSYPQYTVFGEYCMLSVKVLLPAFKLLRGDLFVLDSNKKGKILLEWTPRTANDGSFVRENQIRFGLSPEEVGLILDQLPQHGVELVRRIPPNVASAAGGNYGMPGEVVASNDDGIPQEKIMRINPSDGGMVSFQVESGPKLDVDVQLGEFQVIREILRSSIPMLVGWTTQLELASKRNLEDTLNQSGGQYGRGGVPF